MVYFDSDSDVRRRKGEVLLLDVEAVLSDALDEHKVLLRTPGRVYQLRAEGVAERDAWMDALRAAAGQLPSELLQLQEPIDEPQGEHGHVRAAQQVGQPPLALKHLRPRTMLLDPPRIAAFWQEVRLLRQLPPHPHVVALRGWGLLPAKALLSEAEAADLAAELPRELLFCAMERLPVCLYNVLYESSLELTPLQQLSCVQQVASALAHLHAQGIVFGDLNLANVMCGTPGAEWQFKVRERRGEKSGVLCVDPGDGKLSYISSQNLFYLLSYPAMRSW